MGNFVWHKNVMYVTEQGLIFVPNAMDIKHLMVKHVRNVMAEALSNAMPAVAEGLLIERPVSVILPNHKGVALCYLKESKGCHGG